MSALDASAARARLVGVVRRYRGADKAHNFSDDNEGDTVAERWGVPVSEAMSFL